MFPRRRGARKPGPKGVPFPYGTGDPKTFGRLARWGHRHGLRGRRLRLSDASGAIGNAEAHFAPGSAHHIFRTPQSVHVKQRSTWAQVQRSVPNCTPRRLARADGQTPFGSATRLDAHASRRPPVPARRGRSQRRRRGLASSPRNSRPRRRIAAYDRNYPGRVTERPNVAVLKTAGLVAPRVQIPPLPPHRAVVRLGRRPVFFLHSVLRTLSNRLRSSAIRRLGSVRERRARLCVPVDRAGGPDQ